MFVQMTNQQLLAEAAKIHELMRAATGEDYLRLFDFLGRGLKANGLTWSDLYKYEHTSAA